MAAVRGVAGFLVLACASAAHACAIDEFDCRPFASDAAEGGSTDGEWQPKVHRLPFLGAAARELGHELPATFGVGPVYYYLARDVEVTDVRLGRNGEAPASVSEYAQLSAESKVDNYNIKADVWILPFLDLYAIAGAIQNRTNTTIEVTLPPLLPDNEPRTTTVTVPTSLDGSVGGVGMTLAGGYKWFFGALDVNWARADLGFDDEFKAVVSSLRLGWNGKVGKRPLRAWVNATRWDTAFEVKGTIVDPDDGSTLAFEVDQGPAKPWTYGVGMQYGARPWFDLAVDAGWDFAGGWYIAIVPTVRF